MINFIIAYWGFSLVCFIYLMMVFILTFASKNKDHLYVGIGNAFALSAAFGSGFGLLAILESLGQYDRVVTFLYIVPLATILWTSIGTLISIFYSGDESK